MKKIILSRTDNLGDVILTLPMAGVLKKHFPGIHIVFLGKGYTKPVIERCRNIDQFLDWDELKKDPRMAVRLLTDLHADVLIHVFPVKEIAVIAKKAGIPVRIATTGRLYSWLYCNHLVKMTRRRSNLHEAQLNIRLLEPLGIKDNVRPEDIPGLYGIDVPKTSPNVPYRIIFHPRSKGSAREWGLDNFSKLADLLPPEKFTIYVTGTKEEGLMMKDFLEEHKDRMIDMTGKLTLSELIDLISHSDGMVAASTGPLHIAAALGKKAIGLYAPMRPIFPQRWAPLGTDAHYLVKDRICNDCKKSGDCHCIREITPEEVADLITNY